jgi:uroporphyrinogen-III synthase
MILLIRPQQTLAKSVARFHQHGIACRGMAVQTIDINPGLATALRRDIAAFKQIAHKHCDHLFDAIIVTSQFAAKSLVAELKFTDFSLSELAKHIIALGPSTADKLHDIAHGSPIIIPDQHDSEGVLSLSELRTDNHPHIALIKGVGGRELIANTLMTRGSSVAEYSLYQRLTLDFDWSAITSGPATIELLVVTSGEAATILLDSPQCEELKQLPWLVISERVAKLVTQQGVSSVHISAGASDSALIKCSQEILE